MTAGTHKYGYRASWKFQIENSMDGYHPNFVHQTFFPISNTVLAGSSPTCLPAGRRANARLRQWPYCAGPAPLAAKSSLWRRESRRSPKGPYLEAMVTKYGAERAEEILTAARTHLLVFPNLVLVGVHPRHQRSRRRDRVFPLSDVTQRVPQRSQYLTLRDTSHGQRVVARRTIGNVRAQPKGLRCQVDPWLLLARGLGREIREEDGTLVGQVTDEVTQRGISGNGKKNDDAGADVPVRRRE